jgi:hypothetical protein
MPAVLRELYKRSAMRLQELKNDFDISIRKFDAMIVVFFLFEKQTDFSLVKRTHPVKKKETSDEAPLLTNYRTKIT